MEREIAFFMTEADFEVWLEQNYEQENGIWLRIAKKSATQQSITYTEALDTALCYGWIDGQKAKYDEQSWLQYFCKRKTRSLWSQVNQENIARLTQEGRLKAPGLAAVEQAKLSGQWDSAYQSMSSRDVPEDFEQSLVQSPKAKEFFESLGSQNRFALIFRLSTTKKEETRRKKIAQFIEMLERGQVFHPLKKK